jgi:hypothetical protein
LRHAPVWRVRVGLPATSRVTSGSWIFRGGVLQARSPFGSFPFWPAVPSTRDFPLEVVSRLRPPSDSRWPSIHGCRPFSAAFPLGCLPSRRPSAYCYLRGGFGSLLPSAHNRVPGAVFVQLVDLGLMVPGEVLFAVLVNTQKSEIDGRSRFLFGRSLPFRTSACFVARFPA